MTADQLVQYLKGLNTMDVVDRWMRIERAARCLVDVIETNDRDVSFCSEFAELRSALQPLPAEKA